MIYVENPTGNLLKYSHMPYQMRNTYDGHGGHAAEHREEMKQIAQEEIQKAIPQIQQEAYNQAVSNLLAALKMDIETCVDVGFSTGEEIFHDRKTKQAVLTNVYNMIVDNLQKSYVLK